MSNSIKDMGGQYVVVRSVRHSVFECNVEVITAAELDAENEASEDLMSLLGMYEDENGSQYMVFIGDHHRCFGVRLMTE